MQELSDKMGDHQFAKVAVTCMDCSTDFTLFLERINETSLEIKDGVVLKDKMTGEYDFRCQACFDLNPNAGGKIEIYSRVVGYLRPVACWNGAKQSEFNNRKVPSELPIDNPYIMGEKGD